MRATCPGLRSRVYTLDKVESTRVPNAKALFCVVSPEYTLVLVSHEPAMHTGFPCAVLAEIAHPTPTVRRVDTRDWERLFIRHSREIGSLSVNCLATWDGSQLVRNHDCISVSQ